MNFLSADVEIKVDDSKLKSQLNRAKSAVTKMVDKVKGAFGRMATSFKAAFDKMVRYAKYGAIAIVGALTLMTRAAMKQEDAVFLLSAALKAAGEHSEKVMYRFRAFAASIQEVTKYGDEEILSLMQLMKSLGVTSYKLEEATRMAVGLAAATGRDVNSMAMYIAMAQQGEFTMLRRYIPALRSTTDKTKQLQIITEFAAKGFEIAQAAAETASGSLKQMWNALGDVAERIGGALLLTVKDTATAIKIWAKENEEQIGYWAEVTVAYIAYVKDTIWDYLSFLKRDWKAGIKYAVDVGLILIKDFADRVVKVFDELPGRIYSAIVGGFRKTRTAAYMEIQGIVSLGLLSAKKDQLKALEMAADRAAAMAARGETPPTVPVTLEAKLRAVTPPELRTRFEKNAQALADSLAKIRAEAATTKEAMEQALIEPMKQAAEAAKPMAEETEKALKTMETAAERWERKMSEVRGKMEWGFERALDKMAFEGGKFRDVMVSMFRDMLREIVHIMMIRPLAAQFAAGVIGGSFGGLLAGLFGGVSAATVPEPSGVPGLQRGGTVAKTGFAVVHRGETFSGVGGGNLTVHIHNEGPERLEISEAQSYMISDQRIVDVTTRAMETDLRYRRNISQVR